MTIIQARGSTAPAYYARPLGRAFFDRPVAEVARELLGVWLISTREGEPVGGPIVETEAYGPDDPASHSYRGETQRNAVMFGPPGRLYVYRIYGVHWCMNVSTGPPGHGAAVLLRAIAPELGAEKMAERRRGSRELARGPGRLTEALAVDDSLQGHRLSRAPLSLHRAKGSSPAVLRTRRIGITRAVETPWRFVVPEHPAVSGPRRMRVP